MVWDRLYDDRHINMRELTYNSALVGHGERERDSKYFAARINTDYEDAVYVYYRRVLLFIEVQVKQKVSILMM